MTVSELKAKLAKSLEHLEAELSQIRTGRAHPSLVEDIEVAAYEGKMKLKELGSITAADPQTLLVSPWDKSLLDAIVKAICESDLNLNPVPAGNSLKLPLPPLTEDRRKEFAKMVAAKVEESKTAMRNTRQDAMKDIDKLFGDKKLSEDDKFSQRDQVEDAVKEFIKKIDDLGEVKKQDVMTV